MENGIEHVSLVIPGRDCAATVGICLAAVVPMVGQTPLSEIIFVDDASTDETPRIVAGFPVTYLQGAGQGPGGGSEPGVACGRPLARMVRRL